MIENARRQVALVVVITLVSLFLIVNDRFRLGLDLSGGTQLVYEIDIEGAKARQQIPQDADPVRVMQETVATIGERIDPTGVLEFVITPRGDRQFLIELPQVDKNEAEVIKNQIQNLGKLEMRILADRDFSEDGVTFDLDEEQRRLETWLGLKNASDGLTNRERVAADPTLIADFNALKTTDGGRQEQQHLVWYPSKVMPSYRQPQAWESAFSMVSRDAHVVPAFTPEQYRAGPPAISSPKNKPFLVEFYPINMKERHFTGEQMDASAVHKGNDPETGLPCVFYQLGPDHAGPYADWSAKHVGHHSAIILNGLVRSAPVFKGRIYGTGIIHGGFPEQEANDLAKVIKTGALQVKPNLISDASIGATLGRRSIELGILSMAAGAFLVFAFVILYYRLAGLVAVAGLTLNVFLVLGALQFLRATLTLPGIAGLVLTVGMAVDSNILIFERIREEFQRGKDLLRSVRAGFDRAWVTILDSNLTTFLVGVVLYNVGIGPVRGFAVTLMIGIITTLFTAFFVTRLMFHYLLTKNLLREFKAADWFRNLQFDFLKWARPAFAASMVVIGAGLVYSVIVPNDRKLGLDFTGGANLEVVSREPMTAAQLRERLATDTAFISSFPDPLINTIGVEDASGRTTRFSIKIKLDEAMRTRVAQERADAERQGLAYEPPYKAGVRTALRDVLVDNAFARVEAVKVPGSQAESAIAEVHFTTPIETARVQEQLRAKISAAATAVALEENATTSANVLIEFPVQLGTTTAQIVERLVSGVEGLTDASGNPIVLSNPIPSAEDIGARMVGQLRTAAIGALVISMFIIVMYMRVRFHEYKYGIAAVVALIHDVLVTVVGVVLFNSLGLVRCEIDLGLIAALLTIIGYSINDTIVIFDRVRENLSEQARLGTTHERFIDLINRSMNQTLSRTILTTGATMFTVVAQFVVNKGSGSSLEGFSFALIVGMISGTYSTIYIASPLVLWLSRDAAPQPEPATPAKLAV